MMACLYCGAEGTLQPVSEARPAAEGSTILEQLAARGAVLGCTVCGAITRLFGGEVHGQAVDPWGTVVDAQVMECLTEDRHRGEPGGGGGGSGPPRQPKPGDRQGRPEQEPWPGLPDLEESTTTRLEGTVKSEYLRCRVTVAEKRLVAIEARARGMTESELVFQAVGVWLHAEHRRSAGCPGGES